MGRVLEHFILTKCEIYRLTAQLRCIDGYRWRTSGNAFNRDEDSLQPQRTRQRYIATMNLSRTVSEIDSDFSRKSHFPIPYILHSHCKGYPWNWVSAHRFKKLEWWGYRVKQAIWRYIQPSGYNPLMWRTDAGRQQRPCLHIASCCKTMIWCMSINNDTD